MASTLNSVFAGALASRLQYHPTKVRLQHTIPSAGLAGITGSRMTLAAFIKARANGREVTRDIIAASRVE